MPFDSVSARDGSLVLVRGSHTAPQDCEEICVEAVEPVTETVTLQELALSASCGDIPPEVVIGGGKRAESGRVSPLWGDGLPL